MIEKANLEIHKFVPDQAGVILQPDGTFTVWNTFSNPSEPTDLQREQTKQLMGFVAALRIPTIMEILTDMAADPKIFDKTVDTGRTN